MALQHADDPFGGPQGGIGVNHGSTLLGDIFDPREPLTHGERRLDAFLNRHPIDPLNLRPQRGIRAGAAAGVVLLWFGLEGCIYVNGSSPRDTARLETIHA